jgi:hypothetical protein
MAVMRDVRRKEQVWNVTLIGSRPIMFDRYAGDNQTKLAWWEKLYFLPGTKQIVLPSLNIMSFFSAHHTNSAPKRLRDKRKYKDIANACLAFLSIDEEWIPILRNGEPIMFGDADKDRDELSGVYRRFDVARLDKGIPNPKERPVLPTPWSLEFTMRLGANEEVSETDVKNLLVDGGRAIGLGTFRGVFGKFEVSIE